MSQGTEAPVAAPDDEITTYRIHVSSKYLELTRQKLELARLPRELPESTLTAWWNPKPTLEPMIDFWLENYSWRDQESELNQSVPQYRINIRTPALEQPLRIHFIHAQSPHSNAVPLILIPPFPFTNLSFRHLCKPFSDPADAQTNQPFHLVIPSLPGLGFSDGLPSSTRMVSTIAEVLNTLMKRLGYQHYVATNSGPSLTAQPGADWRITNYLAVHYPDSCLGAHLISPPLRAPRLSKSPIEWVKLALAKGLQAPILGYSKEDLAALQRNIRKQRGDDSTSQRHPVGLTRSPVFDPNTLAYALCDSPSGLLVFFLTILRTVGFKKPFTPTELITATALTWLPGPEGAIRLWAYCESGVGIEETERKSSRKPKVSISVFTGDEDASHLNQVLKQEHTARQVEQPYTCPAWGNPDYEVIATIRVRGKPRLLAWDNPELVVNGVRSLVEAISPLDKRLVAVDGRNTAAPLDRVVVEAEASATA